MLTPEINVLAAQVLTFVMAMGLAWFIYLGPLGEHLRKRREGIAKDLAAADAARAEAEKLKADFAAEKSRLIDENRRLMEKTKADAEAFRQDLLARAKGEHEALLKAGRAQLQQERLEAARQLREEAAGLAVMAAGRLIEKNLNQPAQLKLAKKFIATVKASKN